MPYTSNADLPSGVRSVLPRSAQNVWRQAFNRVMDRTGKDDQAAKAAWGAVEKAGYAKDPETGEYRKMEKRARYRPPDALASMVGEWLKKADDDAWDALGDELSLSQALACGRAVGADVLEKALHCFDERNPSDVEHLGGDAGLAWLEKILGADTPGSTEVQFEMRCEVCKVDSKHGIVFGFAIVCEKDGEPYFDLQDEHIPENEMLSGAVGFMKSVHPHRVNHGDEDEGTVLFAFPLTKETAQAFEITCPRTGLMIGAHPDNPEVLKRYESGELTGFSVRGKAYKIPVKEAA